MKGGLPKGLFWEYDPKSLSLSHGSIEDLRALRKVVGGKEIKAVLMKTKGRGIDRK